MGGGEATIADVVAAPESDVQAATAATEREHAALYIATDQDTTTSPAVMSRLVKQFDAVIRGQQEKMPCAELRYVKAVIDALAITCSRCRHRCRHCWGAGAGLWLAIMAEAPGSKCIRLRNC